MTLRSLKWTFTLGAVTRSALVFLRDLFLLFCFSDLFFFSVFATVLRVLALAPKAFQLRGTFSFLPCSAFHVLVALRPLQLSLSSKRLITVREPDSRGRGWGRPDRMMEGWWVGQGAKLSPALAGSGRRDADGTLWPRTVSLCGSVSAAGPCQRSLSCSLLPLSSLFGYCRSVSLRVCVCDSRRKHETTEGEPWRGLWG